MSLLVIFSIYVSDLTLVCPTPGNNSFSSFFYISDASFAHPKVSVPCCLGFISNAHVGSSDPLAAPFQSHHYLRHHTLRYSVCCPWQLTLLFLLNLAHPCAPSRPTRSWSKASSKMLKVEDKYRHTETDAMCLETAFSWGRKVSIDCLSLKSSLDMFPFLCP